MAYASTCPGRTPRRQQASNFSVLRMAEAGGGKCVTGCHMWLHPLLRFPCDPLQAEGTEDAKALNPPGCPVHGILQQGCWNGLPFLSPGHLPNPGIEPRSPALQADFLLINPKHIWAPLNHLKPVLVLCDHIRLWVQKEARAQCRTKFLFWFEKCTWYKEQHAKQRK